MPRAHPIKKIKEQQVRPTVISATVSFNFWENEDEKYRNKVLTKLCKILREKFKLSATPFYPSNSLEEGIIIMALALSNEKDAKKVMEKVLNFIEDTAEARVLSDSWSKNDIY